MRTRVFALTLLAVALVATDPAVTPHHAHAQEEPATEERARFLGYVELLADDSAEVRREAEAALFELGPRFLGMLQAELARTTDAAVRESLVAVKRRLEGARAAADRTDLVWAGARGGPARSGVHSGSVPGKRPERLWTVPLATGELVDSGIVPSDVDVSCLEKDGIVRTFRLDDGAPLWLANVDSKIQASAVRAANRLVVPTARGLVALDTASGRESWSVPTDYGCNAAPAVDGGVVYASFRTLGVRGLDLVTGEQKFEARLHPSGALLVDRDLIVTGTEEGKLLRLNPENGKPLWKHELGSPPLMGPTLAAPGVIVVYTRDRRLRAIGTESGDERWIRPLKRSSASETLSAAAGRIFLADTGGSLRAYDAGDGSALWNRNAGLTKLGSPCADSTHVLFGSRGRLECRSARTGDYAWRLDVDSLENANPVIADGSIIVLYGDSLVRYR